ncbi:MAG: hypothetical protein AAF411_04275 [Myxococcota bacterium]
MRAISAFVLLLAACSGEAPSLTPQEAASQLIDRNWIDAWPESKDDRLHVFRFVPSMGGGVHQDRNVFEGEFELFTFEATGDEIRFRFPGREEVHTTSYRIEPVDGPQPFTHRLVLDDSPRGPDVYYGWNEAGGATPFQMNLQ